jgi:hypothetical protein
MPMADHNVPTNPLRAFDDETLLDMYEHAHAHGDERCDAADERCDAIVAELSWRGIQVPPCAHRHGHA